MFCCVVRDPVGDSAGVSVEPGVLEQVARAFSPRVMPCGPRAVLFDASGLARVCGPPDVVAREVRAAAVAAGVPVRLALAGTLTAAWVLAHARAGETIVPAARDAEYMAPLPLGWLLSIPELDRAVQLSRESSSILRDTSLSVEPATTSTGRGRAGRRRHHYRMAPAPDGRTGTASLGSRRTVEARDQARLLHDYRDRLATFERWGIRTCGDLAALPRADIHARMGPAGVRLHQAAMGEDAGPLVPRHEETVFGSRLDLDWPIEGLEPLAFVLARQCDRLSADLERADRGAVAIHTTLHLTTRETHTRSLALPAPMREARVLRTLILLDLESHPPPAAIDAIDLRVDVAPGRIVQGSLLARAAPSPEQVSTLVARLGALVGTDRVGAPVLLDTHDGRQVAMTPFRAPRDGGPGNVVSAPAATSSGPAVPHLRRLRRPLAARVVTDHGIPTHVTIDARGWSGGRVCMSAGPWRTSGAWWDLTGRSWDREEWDVELDSGLVCRLVRQRQEQRWEIEGTYD